MWMRNFSAGLLLLLLGACEEPSMPSPFQAQDITWQHAQADFQLTDSNGQPRRLSDFKGQVVALFFGYTHCPDVCPTTLADLAQLMRMLGKDASRVQVLFITLDPQQDSAELLAKFVPSFDSSFLALRGDAQATAQAAQAFGVTYTQQPDKHGGYTLDHTDGIYLLGLGGKPLLHSPHGQRAEQWVRDVKMLLAIGR